MKRLHRYIERVTGLLFGTYRWSVVKPPPTFALTLRSPAEDDMVRFEAVWRGRGFYVTPKSQHTQRRPAPRVSEAWRYRPVAGDKVSVVVTGVITDYDEAVGEFHVRGTVPGMTHIEWVWPFHWATEFTLLRRSKIRHEDAELNAEKRARRIRLHEARSRARSRAQTLREAADAWDSEEEQPRLRQLADDHYQPGGPSMPVIWLRDRAQREESGQLW